MDENQTPDASKPSATPTPGETPASPTHEATPPPPINPPQAQTTATSSTSSPSAAPPSAVPPRMQTPPPPVNPPPPLYSTPPAPAPRGRGRGWMVFSMILLVVLALFIWLAISGRSTSRTITVAGGKSIHHKKQALEELTLEDNNSANKILVIDVTGVISSGELDREGQSMPEDIDAQLKVAEDDSTVKAVILKVNSPGGEVLAADDIYNSILRFQEESGKPVIASMQTLAASGGYYVSAPCRWIVANDLTITGSIGVIMHGFNYRGLMDKVGLKPMTFKSGKFKDMLSGDKNLDTQDPKEKAEIAEERQMVQDLIMETYSKFTNIVATGRNDAYTRNSKSKKLEDQGRPLSDQWTDFIDGRVVSGKKAYELGFVDELGNFDVAKERAQKLADISDANFIQYQQPFDFSHIFKLFGSADSKVHTLKIDLGVNAPNLQVGQLYFIAPTSVVK